ncbi:MAG: hypothetical protein V7L04_00565 [Nostoc sp.]
MCRNALPVWFFRLMKLAISTTGYAYAIVPLPIVSSASTTVLSTKFKASTDKIATIGAGCRSNQGMN